MAERPSTKQPWVWRARAMTTVAAWLAVFLILTVLFSVFGEELESLPLTVRALVISGAVVGLMINVVMPRVNRVVSRLAQPRPRTPINERDARSSLPVQGGEPSAAPACGRAGSSSNSLGCQLRLAIGLGRGGPARGKCNG
jgi:hypothetical protein